MVFCFILLCLIIFNAGSRSTVINVRSYFALLYLCSLRMFQTTFFLTNFFFSGNRHSHRLVEIFGKFLIQMYILSSIFNFHKVCLNFFFWGGGNGFKKPPISERPMVQAVVKFQKFEPGYENIYGSLPLKQETSAEFIPRRWTRVYQDSSLVIDNLFFLLTNHIMSQL